MIPEILGEFFEAGSGRSVLGKFSVDQTTQDFTLIADGEIFSGPVSALKVEPPLGAQPRKIYLPEGHLFQTGEREAMAAVLPKTGWTLLSSFEKFGPHLLPIVIATPLVAFGMYRLIMPLMVNLALGLTPTAMIYQMDKSTMVTLDAFVTDDSELPESRQAEISSIFTELVAEGASERKKRTPKYKLLFRGGKIGPNAFALPGGTVVITDDLVNMFPNNDDLLAGVLGHEIGHVEMEHSMRRLYRALGIAAMVGMMAGDSGPVVEEIILEGGALLSLSFSRRQEVDSDNFAVDLLHEIGRDPEAMALFFEKISDSQFLENFEASKLPFCQDTTAVKDGNQPDTLEPDTLEPDTFGEAAGGADSNGEPSSDISISEADLDPIVKPKGVNEDCREKLDVVLEIETEKKSGISQINREWMSTHPLSEKRIENIRKRAAKLRYE